MYFKNRAQAGRKLARELKKYEGQQVVVVALSPGAVILGAQIAMQLHANLTLLLTESVYLPGENDPIAAMSSAGTFTYNNMFSPGQIEEYITEYHNFIEERRIEKLHKLNILVGKDGEIKKDVLRNHVVIVVSDGLASGFSLDIAWSFLKTVAIKKLVVATPLASVPAVDRMHLFADDIVCLSVLVSYMNTDIKKEKKKVQSTNKLVKLIKKIMLNWKPGVQKELA